MKTRRSAYALNEILIMTAFVVIIMAYSAKMGWTLIRQVPMMTRSFNTMTSTQSMLDALREDVETARDLRLGADQTDPNAPVLTLTLEGPAGRVLYTFADGRMQRSLPDPNAPGNSCWTLPNVKIRCQLRQEDAKTSALRIRTWQQRTFMGKEQVNFEQADLFFLGIQSGERRYEK
jgi:hypothetical protein